MAKCEANGPNIYTCCDRRHCLQSQYYSKANPSLRVTLVQEQKINIYIYMQGIYLQTKNRTRNIVFSVRWNWIV